MRTPTIVMIAKAPHRGLAKTRLAAGLGEVEAIGAYRALVEHQVRQFPSDWSAEVHFTPANAAREMQTWLSSLGNLAFYSQPECDFGGRLQFAVDSAFSRCTAPIMLIATDCPALTREVLSSAATALLHADVVLGPAVDGGFYLLAMRQRVPDIFTGIAWSTERVAAQIRSRLFAARLSCHELSPLEDVDEVESWLRCRSLLSNYECISRSQ